MIINRYRYAIATKAFPPTFYDERGWEYSDFEDIMLPNKLIAEEIIKSFDEPDKYQVLEVKIRYEI